LLKHGLAGWIDKKRANEYNKYFGRKWVLNEETLKLNNLLWKEIRG
jgi:hypothetical protein